MINPLMLLALRNLPRNAPVAGAMSAFSQPEPQPWMPDSAQRPMVAPPGTAPSGLPAAGSSMPGADDRAAADQALARANAIKDPKRGRIGSGEALIAGLVAALAGAAGARNAIPSLQNYLGTKQGLLDQEYGDAQQATEKQRQMELAKYQQAMDSWKERNRLAEQKTDNERTDRYYEAMIANMDRTGNRLEAKDASTQASKAYKDLLSTADKYAIDPEDKEAVGRKFKALQNFALRNNINISESELMALSQPTSKDWLASQRKFDVKNIKPLGLKLKESDVRMIAEKELGVKLGNQIKSKKFEELKKRVDWFEEDRAARQITSIMWANVRLGDLAARVRGQDRQLFMQEAEQINSIYQRELTRINEEVGKLQNELLDAERALGEWKGGLESIGNDPSHPDYKLTVQGIARKEAAVKDLRDRIDRGKRDAQLTQDAFNKILEGGTKALRDYEQWSGMGSTDIVENAKKGVKGASSGRGPTSQIDKSGKPGGELVGPIDNPYAPKQPPLTKEQLQEMMRQIAAGAGSRVGSTKPGKKTASQQIGPWRKP